MRHDIMPDSISHVVPGIVARIKNKGHILLLTPIDELRLLSGEKWSNDASVSILDRHDSWVAMKRSEDPPLDSVIEVMRCHDGTMTRLRLEEANPLRPLVFLQ